MAFTDFVISHLLAWRRAGEPCALVTLVGVDGTAPRRVGSQMAVSGAGAAVGMISSGCAEAAIIAEAVDVIRTGTPRCVRYGAGSPYIDVKLVCGSGIDVHFDPNVPLSALEAIEAAREKRLPGRLALTWARDDRTTSFIKTYDVPIRLVVAGRGPIVGYVADMARSLEWDVIVASPDQEVCEQAGRRGASTVHLSGAEAFPTDVIDAHTALVLLFHDHAWEPAILSACAARPAFYVGALGSRRTHAQRKLALADLGCPAAFIDMIRSPVGLNIGGTAPPEIAVSIIAEIMSVARQG